MTIGTTGLVLKNKEEHMTKKWFDFFERALSNYKDVYKTVDIRSFRAGFILGWEAAVEQNPSTHNQPDETRPPHPIREF
jgi:hypothetical protein